MKEHIKAGMSAIHTPNMFFLTESPPWICGDNDNLSLFIVVFLSVGNEFYFVLRLLIMPITVVLPKRI